MSCNHFSEPFLSFVVNKLLALPFFLLQSPNCCFKTAGTHQLTDTIQHHINAFLANGVVATGIVIGCIFLPSDQLFWMEKFPEGASPYFIWRRKRNCKNILQCQEILVVVVGISARPQSQEVMVPKNVEKGSVSRAFFHCCIWLIYGASSVQPLIFSWACWWQVQPASTTPQKKKWEEIQVSQFLDILLLLERNCQAPTLKKSRIWMAKMPR